MSNNRRKMEVARVREEGRQAALAGKSRESNPYRHMNRYQWFAGFDDEKDSEEQRTSFSTGPMKGMSLSRLIAALTADLEANGDTESVTIGVCVAQANGQRIRLDATLSGDGRELLRDSNYPNGMLCIVADNHDAVI